MNGVFGSGNKTSIRSCSWNNVFFCNNFVILFIIIIILHDCFFCCRYTYNLSLILNFLLLEPQTKLPYRARTVNISEHLVYTKIDFYRYQIWEKGINMNYYAQKNGQHFLCVFYIKVIV